LPKVTVNPRNGRLNALAPRSYRSGTGQVNSLWGGGISPPANRVDYLVIAGGGAGGKFHGGGGGAGGYRTEVGLSVYPGLVCAVTIGAGGAGSDAIVTGNSGTRSQF